jgi:hypothetical protein
MDTRSGAEMQSSTASSTTFTSLQWYARACHATRSRMMVLARSTCSVIGSLSAVMLVPADFCFSHDTDVVIKQHPFAL